MKIYNVIWRVVSIVTLLAVGVWGFFGTSGPAAETAARERAVLSLSGAQTVGNGQPGTSVVVAEPVTISTDAALVTMQTFQPAPSQYERWLAGEIDLDEMEYRMGSAQRQQLAEAAKQRNIPGMGQTDTAISAPSLDTPAIDVSFAALDIDDCCGSGASVPPDSDMAAGPNHLVAVENSSFEIYDKTGATVLTRVLFDAFLAGLGASGTFDPTVLYDQEEGRWVMAIEDGEFFYLMVSDDDNPLGSWYAYEFDAQFYGDEFFDYPHIGIGDHAIFMGANMFGGSVPFGFEGRVYAFEKDDAYANLAVTMVSASVGYDGGTPQPLNLTGWAQDSVPVPFNSHYFVTDFYDGATTWLWQWNNPFTGGVPTVVQTYDFGAVGASGYPVAVPQSGGTSVEGNDWRMRSFEYRNGYAYVVDTVSYDWGTGDNNVLRWHKINLGAAGYPIVDGNFFGAPDLHYIFPDVTADMCDNMAIGFERGGSAQFMETRLVGRLLTDAAGTLQSSIQAKAGEATYTAFDGSPYRWGDYSGMAIDPDGRTFWHMGEYAKSGVSNPNANYGNWITSSSYSQCSVRSFLDVPTNASTWSYIESVYNAGITGGCSTGPRNYCPNNTVTRAQMAIFLLRGIHGGAYTPPAATGTMFTDVSTSTFGAAWIEQLAIEGISGGCGGGKFCPTSSVTRAQMAIFLLRAEHGSAYTPPAATGTMFSDVPSSLSTAAWIEQLANEGITSGCGGGNYCPNNAVSRGQMAIFIQRTFGLALPPFP